MRFIGRVILHIRGRRAVIEFADYIKIDHVQGDPFASPSKVSVAIDGQLARFPKQLFDKKCKPDRAAGLSDKSILSEDRTLQLQGKGFGEKVVCYLSADADRRFWNGQPARLTRQMVTCLCVWK